MVNKRFILPPPKQIAGRTANSNGNPRACYDATPFMQALRTSRATLFRSALLVLFGAVLWRAGLAQEASEEPGKGEASGFALVMTIDDAIGVATAEFFIDSLEIAQDRKANILVLELNTPGGLMTSMEDMIEEILGSDVPVAVYVTPDGARAASAGTFILYASHVAAMSQTTTLGAATPVSLGMVQGATVPPGLLRLADSDAATEDGSSSGAGEDNDDSASDEGESGEKGEATEDSEEPPGKTAEELDAEDMKRKVVNDAVAKIRSFASRRGRNADWAEKAVREGATLEAVEAVEMNVVDFIASDLDDLLEKADGREVDVNGEMVVLQTAGLEVERLEPGWRTQLLSIITNPAVAYGLLLIGLYGLLLEGYNPGSLVPGIVGVICLLVAAYALNLLPVNYAGLLLMALGVGLIIAEAVTPSFGILGLGGVVAFVVGSIILFDTGIPGFEVPIRLIGGVGLAAGLLMLGLVVVLAKSRRRPVVSGRESLVGHRAVALEDFRDAGPVFVQGERWHATSPAPVTKGQELFVHTVEEGLRLQVGESPPEEPARPNLFSLLKKLG